MPEAGAVSTGGMGRRRLFVALVAAAAAGCGGCGGPAGSSSKGSGGSKGPSGSKKSAGKRNRPKGPQTMGNLLVDSYISDLNGTNVDAQIRAARELGNMGSDATSALPALEKVAQAGKPKAAAAAKQALTAIRKR